MPGTGGGSSRIDRLELAIERTRKEVADVASIAREIRDSQLRHDPAAGAAERKAQGIRIDELERWRRFSEGRGMLIQSLVGLLAGLLGGFAALWTALRGGG